MNNQDDIRRRIRARKQLVDDTERREAARRVFDRVRRMAAFVVAERVLLYHSLPDELSTIEFMERMQGKKKFFLPRVNGLNLEILPYERSRMHLGAFRIEEPTGDNTVDISEIDLVIVPAVAFDRHGNRVGRGKGYYDRLLENCRALTIGVGYEFQLVDEIDAEEHDIPLDFVVTDRNAIIRGHKKRR